MIGKNDLITMAHRIIRTGKGGSVHRSMHPHREWYIGLAIAFLIAGTGVVYNTQTFRYYHAIEHNIVPTEAPSAAYDKASVVKVLKVYRAREAAFIVGQEGFDALIPGEGAATSTATSTTATSTPETDPADAAEGSAAE